MNWNTTSFANFSYSLSVKGSAWQDDPLLDAASAKEFSKLFLQVFEKRNKPRRDIQAAIQKWPDLPHFQFLLAECLYLEGQNGEDLIARMRAEHPTYLFSRVMDLYAYCDDQIDDVDFALGGGNLPKLTELYPERTVFHAFEAHQYDVAASYYIAYHEDGDVPTSNALFQRAVSLFFNKREFTMAVSWDIVVRVRNPIVDEDDYDDEYDDEIDEGGNATIYSMDAQESLASKLRTPKELQPFAQDIKAPLQAMEDAQMKKIMDRQKPLSVPFALPSTLKLYGFEFDIPSEFLDHYLAQPREDLISDLVKILEFAPDDYVESLSHDTPTWAPLHAIFLLTELKAEEAIPPFVKFLSLPRPVLNFYLGSFIEMEIEERLAMLLVDDWNAMDDLFFNTEAWTRARILPLRALSRIAYRFESQRGKVENHLLEMLMLANGVQDPYIQLLNSEFILLAVDGRFPKLVKRIYKEFRKSGKLLQEDMDMADEIQVNADFPRLGWNSAQNFDGNLYGFYQNLNKPPIIHQDYVKELAAMLAAMTKPK